MHCVDQVVLYIDDPLFEFDTIFVYNQLFFFIINKDTFARATSLNSICGIKQTYSEDPIHDRLYLLQTLVRILILGELIVIV